MEKVLNVLEEIAARQKEWDAGFKSALLKDIPYFHMLYAKYGNPQFLRLARDAGDYAAKINL